MLKRKNPNPSVYFQAQEILGDIPFKEISHGRDSEVFKFEIDLSQKISSITLSPGKYVLKIRKPQVDNPWNTNTLKEMSFQKLIPKIYLATRNYIIMDYIEGISLFDLIYYEKPSKKEIKEILYEIKKLIRKWHKLGFIHGDLHLDNILITSSKIWFIDPVNDKKFEIHYEDDLEDYKNNIVIEISDILRNKK